MIQWLRLCDSTAGGVVQSQVGEAGSSKAWPKQNANLPKDTTENIKPSKLVVKIVFIINIFPFKGHLLHLSKCSCLCPLSIRGSFHTIFFFLINTELVAMV